MSGVTAWVRAHLLPIGIACGLASVVGTLVRDAIHQPGTVSGPEWAWIAVIGVTGVVAIWALITVAVRRRPQ